MTTPLCERLAWDSQFFGVAVAKIRSGRLEPDEIEPVLRWCIEERIDCLYFLADSPDGPPHAILTSRGFEHVDTRVTLTASLPVPGAAGDGDVRRATAADLGALSDIAAGSHGDTRFCADRRFAPHAERLYRTWIEQSVRGQADVVWVPAGTPATGYLTCHLHEDGGQIGLVGVAAEARGQGIGGRLVRAALAWFHEQDRPIVRVVTQERNGSAMRLYAACGFTPALRQWWYHRWFTPPGSS